MMKEKILKLLNINGFIRKDSKPELGVSETIYTKQYDNDIFSVNIVEYEQKIEFITMYDTKHKLLHIRTNNEAMLNLAMIILTFKFYQLFNN